MFFTDTSPFIELYHEEMKPAIMAQDADRQLRWLEEVLQSSTAPLESSGSVIIRYTPLALFHGDAPELIEQFVPLFDRYGVDLYLCGHEHDLQLHQPPSDTLYLVSGAGSEIRETGRKPFTLFSASANGFATVDLTPYPSPYRFRRRCREDAVSAGG